MSSTPTVAFFGATGGCAGAALVHSLQAGMKVVALVRTPQKLQDQLLAQGIDQKTLDESLIITQGNALDIAAVKKTLTAGGNGRLVPLIITGLGGAPSLRWNWRNPLDCTTLDNPEICATAARTLITALEEIYHEQPALASNKPLLTFISTTGITRGPEDVPFWIRFLYHQILTIPHIDKKNMENLYRDNVEKSNSVISNCIGIRPTLLSGTSDVKDAIGLDKIRSGTEPNPATGYSIKRADVGHWIFTNIIGDETKRQQWSGEMVTLTS